MRHDSARAIGDRSPCPVQPWPRPCRPAIRPSAPTRLTIPATSSWSARTRHHPACGAKRLREGHRPPSFGDRRPHHPPRRLRDQSEEAQADRGEIFGWLKTVGGQRQTRFRGLPRVPHGVHLRARRLQSNPSTQAVDGNHGHDITGNTPGEALVFTLTIPNDGHSPPPAAYFRSLLSGRARPLRS